MSQTATVKVAKSKVKELWVPCASCNCATAHKVLTCVKVHDTDGPVDFWQDHFTIQCGGCKSVSFCSQSSCSEDGPEYDSTTDTMRLAVDTKLYPSRKKGIAKIEDVYALPEKVREIYEETLTAVTNRQPILAGVGIRAIVEAVCKQKRTGKGNLEKRINKLVAKGTATREGAKILHRLRFMGNNAAHDTRAHTPKELDTGFMVAESLLRNVYLMPKIAKSLPLKNRRRSA
jgi:hypothetical protein